MFLSNMENVLKDKTKFEKVDVKTRTLNFQFNQEKRINTISKSTVSLRDRQYKKIKAAGSRTGVLYDFSKVHKTIVDVCPPFRPIFSYT